jgi:hypothetical protein
MRCAQIRFMFYGYGTERKTAEKLNVSWLAMLLLKFQIVRVSSDGFRGLQHHNFPTSQLPYLSLTFDLSPLAFYLWSQKTTFLLSVFICVNLPAPLNIS